MNTKPLKEKPKRVALYTRVSTEEQAEQGYSIEAQATVLTEAVEKAGDEVFRVYSDPGVSGKSMKGRVALAQMLQDAKEGKIDEILVWKLNRLARSQLDIHTILDRLKNYGVTLRSLSENINTGDVTGKMVLSVLAMVGEMERENITANVKLGMKQRARQGQWNGGIVLGYRSESDPGDSRRQGGSRLVVVEEEAEVVRYMFDLAASGLGFKAIANRLNKHGYKTKKGNHFSINGVRDILRNPVYIGQIRYNVREDWSEKRRKGMNPNPIIAEGDHEPIVSQDLWDRAQAMLESRSGKAARSFTGNYPLSGLLRCPECGAGMVAGRSSQRRKDGTEWVRRYYVCSQFSNKGSAACHANSIPADDAERYVFDRLAEVATRPKTLQDIVKKLNSSRAGDRGEYEQGLARLEKELQALDAKRDKWFSLYEEDGIPVSHLRKRLAEIEEQMVALGERKASLEESIASQVSVRVSLENVQMVLSDFQSALELCNPNQRKSLLSMVVQKVTVKNRRVDQIVLTFDQTIHRTVQGGRKKKQQESQEEGTDDGALDSSLMVRFTFHDLKTTIQLLQKNQHCHLMRECKLRK